MNVQVLFFASLREAVGVESLALTLVQGTLAELNTQLAGEFGEQATLLWADNVRIARNHELLNGQALQDLLLVDGDELAFLPPVTGG